jgi:hypothetical protein
MMDFFAKNDAALNTSLNAGNFLDWVTWKTVIFNETVTMACSYTFYWPCTASFDGTFHTYKSLTKAKVAYPFQTAYSDLNELTIPAGKHLSFAILNAAESPVTTNNKLVFFGAYEIVRG